jgi:hypothetical protein
MAFDWSTVVAIGALIIAALVAVRSALNEGISVREYVEFKERMNRDIDRIEIQVRFIEQTRPSSGQLQDAINNIKDQLRNMRNGQ